MHANFSSSLASAALITAVLLIGCQRQEAPGADSVGATGSTVRPASEQGAASTPLPVLPGGLTNASTAAQGNDLTNSTGATGSSNVYEPGSGASQSVSSTTTGTASGARP